MPDTQRHHSNQTDQASDGHIVFDRVRSAFGRRVVHESLSCSFPRGKISVILGGSGSGKSTVLRLIGGLVHPQSGSIIVDGDDITHLSERKMYSVRQKIGMMFQNGALLDSMNIFDNLAFPLREHSSLKEEKIRERVHERLGSVGLSDVDELLPGQLSGGMMKRVALARAIMMEPIIVLCDEAFSGLDPISTKRIEALLVELNDRLGITIVLVSHHIPSTMRMADQVLLLLPGEAISGTPKQLQSSTDSRVVAFLNENLDESELPETEVEASTRRGV